MKRFSIPVTWQMKGALEVVAETIEDANELVFLCNPPQNGNFVANSIEIDYDSPYSVSKIVDGNIKARHTHHNMNDVAKLIFALNHASILIVNGYNLTSWEVEEIENLEDDDVALTFNYTNDEGFIFEFEFTLEALKNATVKYNKVTAVDTTGENVVFELYSMQKYSI